MSWSPQPGPQAEAISADWCPELFYGGAAGGGKSDFLLGDFLQDVPTYAAAWQGIVFRRTYPELESLQARAVQIYPATGAQWFEQKREWRWPNGAVLKMRYLERDADATRYQGHAYTWIGWDELTQWPSLYGYRFLRGRLRSAQPVPTKRIRSAANPGGVGHIEVKSYFIDPAPGGFVPVRDPQTGMERMFVPARLRDNAILLANDPDYAGRLKGLGSEALVRAWLDGDWNVVEGAFFDCWNARMVVKPFAIPKEWARFRSFDWGSASPGSVGWWAVASDPLTLESGQVIPRGAIVRYREWYIAKAPNVGMKLRTEEVAAGIRLREKEDGKLFGVADPAIFKEDGGPSIAETLHLGGVVLRPADNSRVAGWQQMRNRMIGVDGVPMIYVFDTCRDSIRTIPALPHDANKPEDIDTDAEDHAADEWRYACMSRPWTAPSAAKKPERNRDWFDEPDEPDVPHWKVA